VGAAGPAVWRVLLDQGFPVPPGFEPTDLDRKVEYTSLFEYDRRLAKVSTPDWMVILAAAHGGFNAFVANDRNLRSEVLNLVALACTELSLVTWAVGIEDQVTAWAQLVVYMPKIHQRVIDEGPRIFLLPNVRLTRGDHIQSAVDEAHRQARGAGRSYREVRTEALDEMRIELGRRKRADLAALLIQG
jgi:hypothetical protein